MQSNRALASLMSRNQLQKSKKRTAKFKNDTKKQKNLKKEKSLNDKECHFGIIDHKKLSKTIITCSNFSILVRVRKSLIAIFVTSSHIYIFDQSSLLLNKRAPVALLDFINGFTVTRKLVISKLKKVVSNIIYYCTKFLLLLYKNVTFDRIIAVLGLVLH